MKTDRRKAKLLGGCSDGFVTEASVRAKSITVPRFETPTGTNEGVMNAIYLRATMPHDDCDVFIFSHYEAVKT